MSYSNPSHTTQNSSDDIFQSISDTSMSSMPSHVDLLADGVTATSDLAIGDPTYFLGMHVGSDPAILQNSHISSVLNHWLPYENQSSSMVPQNLGFLQYHHHQLHNQDAWTPLRVTGVSVNPSPFVPQHMNQAEESGRLDRRSSTGQYSTISENESQHSGVHPSDSGYSTHSYNTRSVTASSSSNAVDSACSPKSAPHEHEQEERATSLDTNTTIYGDMMEDNESPSFICHDVIKCDYPGCQWTGKCPSDKRKHQARHRKLFKCDEPNCTRKEGFGTINDLARHKKCVHKQDPERGPKVLFVCFGHNCPRRSKKWPRLDNFRQHLARMHNDEDIDELLKKSQDWYETYVKPQEMTPSFVDHFSEETSALQAQKDPRSRYATGNVSLDAYNPIMCNQGDLLSPRGSISEGPANNIDVDGMAEFKHASLQHIPTNSRSFELPALNALNLDSMPDNKPLASQPVNINPQSEIMQDMIGEAAVNMINAMTKIMSSNQRRRSQQSDDGVELPDQSDELSDRKREVLQKILSTALDRLPGNSGPIQNPSHMVSKIGSDQKDWIQCEFCTKRTRLRCQMKKHKMRHERPYGCTFHKCNKTFGSKAEWKKHETSQHEVRAAIGGNHMGRNGQSQFWCGFCQNIVPLKSQGLAAWNERFNHIDIEHFKKGERIGNWLLPSGHLTKNREREEEKTRAVTTPNKDYGEPVMDDNSDNDSGCSSYHSDNEALQDEPDVAGQLPDQSRPFGQFDGSFPLAEQANLRKRKLPVNRPALDYYYEGEGDVLGLEKRSKARASISGPSHVAQPMLDLHLNGEDTKSQDIVYALV